MGVLVLPAAANASPTVIDPRCTDAFGGAGIAIQDPVDMPAGLPPQVTQEDMACSITAGLPAYLYFDDPFGKLVEITNSLIADGWTVRQVLEDDSIVPFDVATLPQFENAEEFTLSAIRGADNLGTVYSSADPDLGAVLYVFALPLTSAPATPTPSSGTAIDDPSSMSELRTLATAVPNPAQSAVLLGTATALTVLLAIPGFLLSTVFSSRYDQWFGWASRGRFGALRKRTAALRTGSRRWLFIGGGLVLAAFISGFVDPRFGFNGMSLRLFFTMLLSLVLFNVGAWATISAVLNRTSPEARPALSFHPAALLVLAAAVALSRLLGFSPGVVFGLVAGVAFAITLALSGRALVILVGSGYAVAVALIAWVAYSLINSAGPPDDAWLVAVSEFFSGVTIEGVSTLPIALIPLANLDGGTLFTWKKWVWALCYVAGMAVFMLVLFTIPGGEAEVSGDFGRWILIFGIFVALAVVVWLIDLVLRRREKMRLDMDSATR